MFNKDKGPLERFNPLKIVGMILVFAAIVAALSALVMYLWNTILTDVTNVKPLTFWKAMGLLLLAKILFGGVGKGFGRKGGSKRKHWKNKWMNMSPEERNEAKSRWKEHCNKRNKPDHDHN